jgi:hypothetical protein
LTVLRIDRLVNILLTISACFSSATPLLEGVVKAEADESFFVPVPLKEPPKYDDVIRSKQARLDFDLSLTIFF